MHPEATLHSATSSIWNRSRQKVGTLLLGTIFVGFAALGAETAFAAPQTGDCAAEYTSGQGGLNCTSNDDGGSVTAVNAAPFCTVGMGATFDLAVTFTNNTSAERLDTRYWVSAAGTDPSLTAANGGPAICQVVALPIGFGGGSVLDWESNGDTCGDVASGQSLPLSIVDTITLDCIPDESGFVHFNSVITWDTNPVYDCEIDALRGPPQPSISKSKCAIVDTTLVTEFLGRVTVVKEVDNADTLPDFTFNWSTTAPPLDLDNAAMNPPDPFTLSHGEFEEIFSHVESDAPAVVTITEQDPIGLGFTYGGVDCPGASVNVIPGGVEVTLAWDPDNPQATDVVCTFTNNEIVGTPAMTVSKTADTGLIDAPGTVTYQYLVTNTGSLPLVDVTLEDDNDNNDVDCSPDPYPFDLPNTGDSVICTATHTVTQGQIDANGDPTPGSGVVYNEVTATALIPGIPPLIETDDLSIPILYDPTLSIVKTGIFNDESADMLAQPGETISYSFEVTNTGNVTLNNVTVSDPLVGTITCPSGNGTFTLDPGDSETCTGSYPVTQADIDAGQVLNTGFADSDESGQVSDDETVPLPQGPALTVDKDSTTTEVTAPGVITYTYLVENTGNVTLTGLFLVDDLTAGAPSCVATTLAPGATTTCDATYTVTQTDIDNNGVPTPGSGSVDNIVVATASSPGNTDDVQNTDNHSIPISLQPGLGIVKDGNFNDDGDGVAEPGETISYTFDVTNTGNVTLTNVAVTDSLGITVSCAPEDNPIADLDPQESVPCTATYPITQADIDAGQVFNVGTADSDQAGPVTDDHTEPLAQSPDIMLAKQGVWVDDGDGAAEPGELVTYTFTVTNTGNVTLSDVTVNDPLVGTITCPSGNGTFSLAPGAMETCTGSYAIDQDDINLGRVDNTADVAGLPPGDDLPVTDTASDSVNLPQEPGIALVKTGVFNDGGDGLAQPGETISYTLRVSNSGNITLTNVSVSDPLLGTITCPGGNPFASLLPGTFVDCTGSYAIDQADIDAGQVDNTASANSTEAGPTQASETVPLPTRATKTLAKSGVWNDDGAVAGAAEAGETVTYSLVVSNTGNLTLTNVLISDPLLGTITCPSGNGTFSLAPGAMETCTGTYTLTQNDVDAGKKDNTALATSVEAPQVSASATVTYPTLAQLSLAKNGTLVDESQDGFAQAGETIAYTFVVTNTGTVTLTNIAVTDPIVSPISCPGGNPIMILAPGGVETCTGSYTIMQGDIDAGVRNNTATADSDQTDPVQDNASVPLPQNPLLTLVKSSPTTSISSPVSVPYSYVVTNSGNITLTGISVVDDNITGTVTCPGSSLVPGANLTCTAARNVTQGDIDADGSPVAGSGLLVNNATATSNEAPPATDDFSIPIVLDASLMVIKSSSTGEIDSEGPVDYSYKVTNIGNVTLTGIHVEDDNADGESCAAAVLAPGASTTCTATHVVTEQELQDGGSPVPGSGILFNTVIAYGSSPGAQDDVTATDTLSIAYAGAVARFNVTKDFTDDNPAKVMVHISCNTGLPLQQDFEISETQDVTFVVTSFLNGDLNCTITEQVPAGYTPSYDNGTAVSPTDCTYKAIAGRANFSCHITNTPDLVEVDVHKVWQMPNEGNAISMGADITIWCDTEIDSGYQQGSSGNWFKTFSIYGDATATAMARPAYPSSRCWAVESGLASEVEVLNECGDSALEPAMTISAGQGDQCTITNTIFFEGIPTLSRYGMALLILLLLGVGAVGFRRFV